MTETDAVDPPTTPPTLTFESITFSDDTTLNIGPTDIVTLVGPNNAGKSLALRELATQMHGSQKLIVFKDMKFRRVGTVDDLRAHLLRIGMKVGQGSATQYRGFGFNTEERTLSHWDTNPKSFGAAFQQFAPTEARIVGSNQVGPYDVLNGHPAEPLQQLYTDPELEKRLSGYFKRAFGKDLIFVSGGSSWSLYVGERPRLQAGEERSSKSYLDRLIESAVPLMSQGDGMRSFVSVMLRLFTSSVASVLFLDEPEAFLHPPQAQLIGELIAKEAPTTAQIFVATHSPDVLHGLLSGASERLHVLRMERKGDLNSVRELDQSKARQVASDPVMRYAAVLSGLFHRRVIVCESDADCMFYSSILAIESVHGAQFPDVLFLQAGGKHRLAAMAGALRPLGVSVDVIADIDVLNEVAVLESIVNALGGDWPELKVDAEQTKAAIEQRRPGLSSVEVKKDIGSALSHAPDQGELPRKVRAEIESVLRRSSAWGAVKEAGEAAIPAGQPTERWQRLRANCAALGLWIVPVGELEGFCKSVGGHGPTFARRVLEERDIATDADLRAAREFMANVWSRTD